MLVLHSFLFFVFNLYFKYKVISKSLSFFSDRYNATVEKYRKKRTNAHFNPRPYLHKGTKFVTS